MSKEEILEEIAWPKSHYNKDGDEIIGYELDVEKLATFLAEHLKS